MIVRAKAGLNGKSRKLLITGDKEEAFRFALVPRV
jgi:hypothetical protein